MHFFLLVAMTGSYIIGHDSFNYSSEHQTAAKLIHSYCVRCYLGELGVPREQQFKVIMAATRAWAENLMPEDPESLCNAVSAEIARITPKRPNKPN